MNLWADLDDARTLWAGAPDDDALLQLLLDAAFESCEAYAPVLAVGDPVPFRYTEAVVYQARDDWTNGTSPNVDLDGVAVPQRPMSPKVKALLRPKPGVPAVG